MTTTGGRRVSLSDDRHGPLPALLLGLTVVTGLVDAVSILSLGRVFVANMTGNVVFIGFALAGASGFSLSASVSALVGFLVGAGAGGKLARRWPRHRGRQLLAGAVTETVLVSGGVLILALVGRPIGTVAQDGVAGMVAIALGTQNAVVRALAVPDLTTTVLTLTLTGLAADLRSGLSPTSVRRMLAVIMMFAGALVGALLDLKVSATAGLGSAAAALAVVTGAAARLSNGTRTWHPPPS